MHGPLILLNTIVKANYLHQRSAISESAVLYPMRENQVYYESFFFFWFLQKKICYNSFFQTWCIWLGMLYPKFLFTFSVILLIYSIWKWCMMLSRILYAFLKSRLALNMLRKKNHCSYFFSHRLYFHTTNILTYRVVCTYMPIFLWKMT